MKKVTLSVIAMIALAGCASYDYYEGGVRYTQDGKDCIYSVGEYGNRFSMDVRGFRDGKRIVYRNTRCEDLYARDTFGRDTRQERKVLATTVRPSCATCNSCGTQIQTSSCGCGAQPIDTAKYVFVR